MEDPKTGAVVIGWELPKAKAAGLLSGGCCWVVVVVVCVVVLKLIPLVAGLEDAPKEKVEDGLSVLDFGSIVETGVLRRAGREAGTGSGVGFKVVAGLEFVVNVVFPNEGRADGPNENVEEVIGLVTSDVVVGAVEDAVMLLPNENVVLGTSTAGAAVTGVLVNPKENAFGGSVVADGTVALDPIEEEATAADFGTSVLVEVVVDGVPKLSNVGVELPNVKVVFEDSAGFDAGTMV